MNFFFLALHVHIRTSSLWRAFICARAHTASLARKSVTPHVIINMALTCLFGWQRRSALVLLGLFMLGWLVYSVGFVWYMITTERATHDDHASDDLADPIRFPQYIALIGGPVVYVSGVLHAMLPGVACALVGIPFAFLNVIYFSSVSWIVYINRSLNVSSEFVKVSSSASSATSSQAWLMFAGTLFAVVCWCLLLTLAVFYKNPNDSPQALSHHNQLDCLSKCTRATNNKRPFPGATRLASIPLLILSAIGWCTLVVGYHQWNTAQTEMVILFDDHASPVVIAVFIIGPLLHLASLLHTGCSRRASTMCVFTVFLYSLHVACSGVIVTCLIQLKIAGNSTTEHYVDYMLGGCTASVLFLTFNHSLMPFHQEFQVSRASRVMENVGNLSHDVLPQSERGFSSPPPDYNTTVERPGGQEGGDETQPLLAESPQ